MNVLCDREDVPGKSVVAVVRDVPSDLPSVLRRLYRLCALNFEISVLFFLIRT